MKKLVSILIILNCINLVYAASLGISPSSIEFKSKANEKACSKVVLFSSSNSTLFGESKWKSGSQPEKDIRYYSLNPESLGIALEYPEDVKVESKKEIEVCLISKKEGDYHGALIYSIENKPAAVGTWIHASIQGKAPSNKITGAFLNNANKPPMVLYLPTILLLFIFIILLMVMKKKTTVSPHRDN